MKIKPLVWTEHCHVDGDLLVVSNTPMCKFYFTVYDGVTVLNRRAFNMASDTTVNKIICRLTDGSRDDQMAEAKRVAQAEHDRQVLALVEE